MLEIVLEELEFTTGWCVAIRICCPAIVALAKAVHAIVPAEKRADQQLRNTHRHGAGAAGRRGHADSQEILT